MVVVSIPPSACNSPRSLLRLCSSGVHYVLPLLLYLGHVCGMICVLFIRWIWWDGMIRVRPPTQHLLGLLLRLLLATTTVDTAATTTATAADTTAATTTASARHVLLLVPLLPCTICFDIRSPRRMGSSCSTRPTSRTPSPRCVTAVRSAIVR